MQINFPDSQVETKERRMSTLFLNRKYTLLLRELGRRSVCKKGLLGFANHSPDTDLIPLFPTGCKMKLYTGRK